jgi:hypothetical protein
MVRYIRNPINRFNLICRWVPYEQADRIAKTVTGDEEGVVVSDDFSRPLGHVRSTEWLLARLNEEGQEK